MNHLFWIISFHCWGYQCELEFYDLDQTYEPTPTLEPNLTPEPKLDLSIIPESVSVPIPLTFEAKSSIPQNHILLLDQGLN